MDWLHLFTSFKGRIARKPFWIGNLALIGAVFMAIFTIASARPSSPAAAFPIPVIAVLAAIVYPSMALGVKRLHDRNKSAWWLLPFYVLPHVLNGIFIGYGSQDEMSPLTIAASVLSLWALVELGALPGTQGPNRYGTDPLGVRQADASF